MRQISKGEGPKIKYSDSSVKRKRKYQSSEKQSVQDAAKDFLEKAARELFGDNKDGFKGPLQVDASVASSPPSLQVALHRLPRSAVHLRHRPRPCGGPPAPSAPTRGCGSSRLLAA